MKTYIALFRGINVGGKNILPMKELVTLLEGQGCRNARTYIQSGNAVFESEGNDALHLSNTISVEKVSNRVGIKPQWLVLFLHKSFLNNFPGLFFINAG